MSQLRLAHGLYVFEEIVLGLYWGYIVIAKNKRNTI